MSRTVDEILAHADELAKTFEDYEPRLLDETERAESLENKREQRRAQMRAEALGLRNDSEDLAATRQLTVEMEQLRRS